jgi:hypothetical protein
MYFAAGGVWKLGVTTAGVTIPTLTATTATITTSNNTTTRAGNGTVGAPSYSFTGDTNTGIYRTTTADAMYFAAGGAWKMGVTTTGVTINTHLLPATNNSFNIGSGSLLWNTIYATNGTINTSDINLKKNIKDLSYGVDDILKINPISFNWKDETTGTDKKLGFSAQELQKIIPEVIRESEDGILGVYYSDLIPVAFNAIKEQQSQIDELKIINENFQKELEELKKLVK